MPRNYRHIKEYEKEILELKTQGLTKREIGNKLGFSKDQIHNFISRYNENQRRVTAGIALKRRGRPPKDYVVKEEDRVAELIAVSDEKKEIYLMELKKHHTKKNQDESLLRCVCECYTYWKQICHKKLAKEISLFSKYPKSKQVRNEKREKTIERKKKEEAELLERLGDESLVDFLGRTNISEKDKEIARRILKRNLKRKARNKAKGKFEDNGTDIIIADDSDDIYFDDDDFEDTLYYDNPLPYKHLEFYNNHHKNNRTWNLLLDLHNFFIRHKGCLLSRNMYFFIIACFIKQIGHDEDYSVRYCYRYVDADYYNEMEYIVGSVYHSKKEYRFRYSTVADILGFTEEDYERSYCCYTEAQRKARKKEQNKKYYADRKEKAGKTPAQLKKESQIEFVRNNINLPDADLMKALGVSRSTVQRLKKKI